MATTAQLAELNECFRRWALDIDKPQELGLSPRWDMEVVEQDIARPWPDTDAQKQEYGIARLFGRKPRRVGI